MHLYNKRSISWHNGWCSGRIKSQAVSQIAAENSKFVEVNDLKPGFHIVVSVVSVVSVLSKKFLRQIQLYGNLAHNRPIRQIQHVLRDRNGSISYNRYNRKWAWHDSILLIETTASDSYDRYNKNVSRNALRSAAVTVAEATDTTDTTIWKPKILNCRMSCVCAAGS